MGKNIYLVRHCAASGQAPDAELSVAGQEQALQLAEFLSGKPIDRLISSPFRRARASIAPLAKGLDLTIETDERLVERTLSTQALPEWRAVLEQSFSDLDRRWLGGESSREAMVRGRSVLDELLIYPEKNFVVVTHGNLMSLILRSYSPIYGFESWASLSNPDVFVINAGGGAAEISHVWRR